MRVGTFAGALIIIIGLLSYFVCTALGLGERMLGLLFGAFGIQIAIAPVVLGAVFLDKYIPSSGWALASALFGFAGGVTAMIISFFNTEWQYLPPLYALVCSVLIFLIGILFSLRIKK